MIPSFLLVSLLFFLPFLFTPFGFSPFEGPKVYLAEIGTFLLVLTLLWKKTVWKLNKPILLCLVLLFVLSLVALINNFSIQTLFGNAYRLQGTFLFIVLLLFTLFSSQVSLPSLPSPFYFFLITAELLFTYGIVGQPTRSVGTFGEPNALALFAVSFFPFLLFSENRFSVVLKTLGILFLSLILFSSDSRSGILAFIIQIIFLTIFRFSKSLSLSLLFGIVLFIGTLVLPFVQNQDIYENRSEIWIAAVNASVLSPFVGSGFGNINSALRPQFVLMDSPLAVRTVDSTHNIFLDFLVALGVPGLLVFMFLLFLVFESMYMSGDVLSLTLLLGLLVGLSFNPASVVHLVAFYFVIGRALGNRFLTKATISSYI